MFEGMMEECSMRGRPRQENAGEIREGRRYAGMKRLALEDKLQTRLIEKKLLVVCPHSLRPAAVTARFDDLSSSRM